MVTLILALALLICAGTCSLAIILSARSSAAHSTLVREEFKRIFAHNDRLIVAQLARIEGLENQLQANAWPEYAQLQNDVIGPVQRTVAAWDGMPPRVPEPVGASVGASERPHGYGSSREDMLESYLATEGVDMEGPTVG